MSRTRSPKSEVLLTTTGQMFGMGDPIRVVAVVTSAVGSLPDGEWFCRTSLPRSSSPRGLLVELDSKDQSAQTSRTAQIEQGRTDLDLASYVHPHPRRVELQFADSSLVCSDHTVRQLSWSVWNACGRAVTYLTHDGQNFLRGESTWSSHDLDQRHRHELPSHPNRGPEGVQVAMLDET